MAREVKWTETAWEDLEEVANFIARDSSHYAAAFVREARDAARTLAYLAERGRLVPELNDQTIRELFVRSYRLVYCIIGQIVYILGFVHGARDLLALWEREKRPRPEGLS